MERKDFLKKTIALCGLSLIPAAVIESCSKSTNSAPTNVNFTLDLTVAANNALNSVGGSLNANGVIVICTGSGAYTALSASCTHEGCTVSYDKTSTHLVCPCHGGVFSNTGAVVSGPPPSALTKYTVTKNGNVLTVKS